MLNKKATELTYQVLSSLCKNATTFNFVEIQPIILKELETAYLQGRKDQVDRVTFEQLPNGALKFQDK